MTTKIEWTDETWNPVTGCTKVSPGCDHCYAETIATRFAGKAAFPKGFQVTLRPNKVNDPLRWRTPRRVFVNSMSDLFHDEIPDPWLADIFAVMAAAQRHTFQVLTKRHGRMRALLKDAAFAEQVLDRARGKGLQRADWRWPLSNVWLGVSAENQATANLRVPALLETPAEVRFVSAEPLLGPVDLTSLQRRPDSSARIDALSGDVWHHPSGDIYAAAPGCIDWVIVGGESGRKARPMHPGWARDLQQQTTKAGRAFLFKQWGEWVPLKQMPAETSPGTSTASTVVAGKTVYRVGKHRAGRLLDGRAWDEFPGATS